MWSWHRRGTTIETLLRRYPQLGPAKVLDALAFAYDNEELVEADLAEVRSELDRIRDQVVPEARDQGSEVRGKGE